MKENRCHIIYHFSKLISVAVLAAFLIISVPGLSPVLGAEKKKTSSAVKKSGKSSTKASKKASPKKNKKTVKKAKPAPVLPWPQNLEALVGKGAVLVLDPFAPRGFQELYAHNADNYYTPASAIKVVTAAAALEFLGADYRFKTEFALTQEKDLWVIGYGDPYLVSEEVALIAQNMQKKGLKEVNNIYIDSSYFQKGLVLDGNTQTDNPYDAYNCALGIDFNTLNFQKNKQGKVLKAAPHIPLTPMAIDVASKTKGRGSFCLNIYESPDAAELHAGQLLKAHLEETGIPVNGEVYTGVIKPKNIKVFYRHESSLTLAEIIEKFLRYSNNFMTNQVFLAMGAELYGAPANLEKSQAAMKEYFARYRLANIDMFDGSGLSRKISVTARQMADVLLVSKDYVQPLLRLDDNGLTRAKTGTMSDIKTLAGYLERPGVPDKPLLFVILLNGSSYGSGDRGQILKIIQDQFILIDDTSKIGVSQ